MKDHVVLVHSYGGSGCKDSDEALGISKFEYHRGRIEVKDNPILLRGSVEIQQDDELSEKSHIH